MQVSLLSISVVFVSILISMTLHEAMHAFTSHWLGDDTASREGRLTLNPLAHIDLFTTILLPLVLLFLGLPPFGAAKPVPFDPYNLKWGAFGAAIVGIAGPLTNLMLAVIAGLILRVGINSFSSLEDSIIALFVEVNISFFLFNMIPFPPLDGSRVLYAIAPDSIRSVMRFLEGVGIIGILAFVFLLFPLFSSVFTHVFNIFFQFIVGTPLS